MPQLYEMKIVASGTVRDAEGNVLNQDVEMESVPVTMTEAEVQEMILKAGLIEKESK